VGGEGVEIRRGLRSRTIRWDEIADVDLLQKSMGEQGYGLDVVLVRPSGGLVKIRPDGIDLFDLHAKVGAGLDRWRRAS